MTKYVALLRGIGPGNPNMHGSKLVGVLEDLGFANVRSFISSGNVLFESPIKDTAKLELMIEEAWPQKLGFNSTTIIRSQAELQALVALNPFKGATHSRQSYLLVTFFKSSRKASLELPYTPPDKAFSILGGNDRAVWSSLDTTSAKTPDLMVWLEKQFGRDITSRTWNTINRSLAKMA